MDKQYHNKMTQWALWILMISIQSISYANQNFTLPIRCSLNNNCVIQNYPAIGKNQTDYNCGKITYPGHKGTDFRIINPTENIIVQAVKEGRVLNVRNNMNDHHFNQSPTSITNKECGNGVVIQHEHGIHIHNTAT